MPPYMYQCLQLQLNWPSFHRWIDLLFTVANPPEQQHAPKNIRSNYWRNYHSPSTWSGIYGLFVYVPFQSQILRGWSFEALSHKKPLKLLQSEDLQWNMSTKQCYWPCWPEKPLQTDLMCILLKNYICILISSYGQQLWYQDLIILFSIKTNLSIYLKTKRFHFDCSMIRVVLLVNYFL